MGFVGFILLALKLLSWIIIGDAILSWIMPSTEKFPRNVTSRITEPLYKPVHLILDPRKTGGFDLAPLIVLVAIQLISNVLVRYAGTMTF